MDIKEGHPGAVFNWFFDTDQGSEPLAEILVMLYGSGANMVALAETCLNQLEAFNDALGQKILFLFFCPDTPIDELAADAASLRTLMDQQSPVQYLMSGTGESRPLPTGMMEIGTKSFRSGGPTDSYYNPIAVEVVKAHKRAIPFFQKAFDIPPLTDAIIFSYRSLRLIDIHHLQDEVLITVDELKQLFASINNCFSSQIGDAERTKIDTLIKGKIEHASFRRSVERTWDAILKLPKLFSPMV